jgi:hypothetical protein
VSTRETGKEVGELACGVVRVPWSGIHWPALVLVFILALSPSSALAQTPPTRHPPTAAAAAISTASAKIAAATPALSSYPIGGVGYSGGNSPTLTNARYILAPLVLLLIFLIVVFRYFIRIFATPLPDDKNCPAERVAIARMVKFCYFFTLLSLVAVISPLAALNVLPGSITSSYYIAMAESPVALVLGCVHYANPEDRASELACKSDRLANEWLVNIGGLVLQRLPYSQTYSGSTPDESPPSSNAAPPELSATDTTTDWVDDHVGASLYNLPPMTIHEGVTVPFYFILIALFGAAVSLVRRVPEIQRRYLTPNDQLDAAGTRELLVSQILQFLSAPIIAITAYAVFAPSGPSSSVVLAFVSGFSSDAVIAAFKGIADSIISTAKGPGALPLPPPPAPPPPPSPALLSPASASPPVSGAAVMPP